MRLNGVRPALALVAVLLCPLFTGVVSPDAARAGGIVAGPPATGSGPGQSHGATSRSASRPVSPAAAPGEAGSRTWTRQQMLAARPARFDPSTVPAGVAGARTEAAISGSPVPSEVIPDPSLPGFRTNGKLFFRLGDGPDNGYTCSGTMVRSQRRNVVFTAGHCVFDSVTASGPRVWAHELSFVPAYHDGQAPFGQFPVADLVTTQGWKRDRLQSFDLAVLALEKRAQDVVGAKKIEFDAELRSRSLEIFGYPAKPEPEMDGEKLIRCVPATTGFDTTLLDPYPFGARPCSLREGASGGGWIFDNRYLVSVVSYGYCDNEKDPPVCSPEIYGPQFGSAAINLINSAAIGGTATPTVKVLRRPPRRVRKRAVSFRVTGNGSTPVREFKVRLDRNPAVVSGPTIRISRLSRGRHRLWIRSMDQTRKLSSRTIKRTFRVLPRKKKRKRPHKRR